MTKSNVLIRGVSANRGFTVFLPEIQLPALVKIKDCCTRKFLRQSFQLRKSQNNQRYLDKSFTYHTEPM